jgi:thiamine kinase
MYSDSFFRHTHKMLKVLKEGGLIRSGIRSQSGHLEGGYWNRVSHFQSPGKNWVIKQFLVSEENLMFPNLPDHEAQALRDLDGTSIAPGFVDFFPDADGGPVIVYKYEDGGNWRDDAPGMGRLLKSLHSTEVSDNYRTLNVEPADILSQSDLIMANVKTGNPVRTELESLRPQPVPHPGGNRPCLVHTDCGPGNVIVGESGPVLIDWQCPGVGDPIEDLACFTSPGIQSLYDCPPLRDEQISQFLEAYDDEIVVGRFHELRIYFHYRLACYFLSRCRSLNENNAEQSRRYDQALDLELALLRELAR